MLVKEATGAKQQANSNHNGDKILIVLAQFHTKI